MCPAVVSGIVTVVGGGGGGGGGGGARCGSAIGYFFCFFLSQVTFREVVM